MPYTITLIPGDGVGPQIVEAARRVIDATGVPIKWEVVEAGEAMIEKMRDAIAPVCSGFN